MDENDEVKLLLTRILEVQRAHLEEYKRVTSQSLELQRHAVEMQSRHVLLYRRVLLVGAILIVGLLGYVVWLSRHIA